MNTKTKTTIFAAALTVAFAAAGTEILPGRAIDQVTWETLTDFCKTNAREVKGPVKGIIVEHPWFGQQDMEYCSPTVMERATKENVVYFHSWAQPWSWMSNQQLALTDRIIDVIIEHFGLPQDVKIVSTGKSMGGHGALTYPQLTKKNVVAAVANCPPCDLLSRYADGEDMPRALYSAYSDEPDFRRAVIRHSPLATVEDYRDITYYIYQTDADRNVIKEKHSDRFVEAAAKRKKGPLKLTYRVGKGEHVKLEGEDLKAFDAAIFDALGIH